MQNLGKYIKQFSPKEEDKAILIYDVQYHLWLEGNYLGMATWTEDKVLGDSFQNHVMLNGEFFQVVYVADTWALIVKDRKQKPTN
jgi:hypothetical protein